MLKQILTAILASLGFASISLAGTQFTIGESSITAPDGWREIKREEQRVTLRSADDRQQATVSLMQFGTAPSFDEFKRLCALRYKAEKSDAPDAFMEPEAPAPFEKEGRYGLFFSGGEKKSGRIFSGYISLVNKELITIYLEAAGVAPKEHLASFEAFVSSLKRNAKQQPKPTQMDDNFQ